jgi:hypothetical protein
MRENPEDLAAPLPFTIAVLPRKTSSSGRLDDFLG